MNWWKWALALIGIYLVFRWWISRNTAGTAALPAQSSTSSIFTYPYTYGGALASGTPQGTNTSGIGFGTVSPVALLPSQPAFPAGVSDYDGSVPVSTRPRPVGPARGIASIF